jgi:hypothetical protein
MCTQYLGNCVQAKLMSRLPALATLNGCTWKLAGTYALENNLQNPIEYILNPLCFACVFTKMGT